MFATEASRKSVWNLCTLMGIACFLLCFSGCVVFGQRSIDPGRSAVMQFRYTMPIGADELPSLAIDARDPPSREKQEKYSFRNFDSPERGAHAEQQIWGYKIQIFSSLQQDEAENEANVARGKLAEKVFVEFDPPYYKVRVGNCSNPEQAEKLLEKIRRKGYSSAWIVRARVVAE